MVLRGHVEVQVSRTGRAVGVVRERAAERGHADTAQALEAWPRPVVVRRKGIRVDVLNRASLPTVWGASTPSGQRCMPRRY